MTDEERDPYSRVVGALGRLTGLFAGLAAAVYLSGGLVLSLRLGLERLPSTAAVAQLPREFLVSLGLTLVMPAIAAGGLTWWLARRGGRRDTSAVVAGLAVAAVLYVAVGGAQVAKAPFPAKACLAEGGETSGVFIGETDSRTYLGDPTSAHPRRIISIPQSAIERVPVGGSEQDLAGASCGRPR